eukprot:294931_1
MCDDYNIEDTATSVAVEISTPFQLKNQLSNVSELFNMTDNMRQATEPQLMTVDDVDVDETLCESSVSHSHYAPTETTETATYRDGRSRRHSNSGQIIIEYNEDEDILPAILEQMDSKNHDKNVEQHNQNLKHMNANGGMDDILGLDSTMYIEDAMSCSTHSHSDMRPQQIQARYSSGLALKQSDSNNAHTTHDAIYDSNNEMDEDFYDLLSDAVCDLFIKLDTKNKKAVSDDIIKIGFALLDINLSDNEFNMFIAEITNHKTRKSKMIRLDMLRSFVLNIQNKNYHHTLNRIRSVIIDGLLSAQPSVGASHSNSMKRSSNNSPNQRSKPKLSRHPSHSPPPPHMNNAHTQAIRARHSVVVTPHHSHAHTHAPRGQTVSLSTLPTISSPTVTMNQHFSDPTMSTLPALPNLPSLPSQPQTKYASRSRKKNKQHQQPPTHTMQLQWRPHITDHDENGASQYDLLRYTLKYIFGKPPYHSWSNLTHPRAFATQTPYTILAQSISPETNAITIIRTTFNYDNVPITFPRILHELYQEIKCIKEENKTHKRKLFELQTQIQISSLNNRTKASEPNRQYRSFDTQNRQNIEQIMRKFNGSNNTLNRKQTQRQHLQKTNESNHEYKGVKEENKTHKLNLIEWKQHQTTHKLKLFELKMQIKTSSVSQNYAWRRQHRSNFKSYGLLNFFNHFCHLALQNNNKYSRNKPQMLQQLNNDYLQLEHFTKRRKNKLRKKQKVNNTRGQNNHNPPTTPSRINNNPATKPIKPKKHGFLVQDHEHHNI